MNQELKNAIEYIKQRWEDDIASQTRAGKRRVPSFDQEIEIIAGFYSDYLAQGSRESGK